MWTIFESKIAQKQLDKIPVHILKRYEKWKDIVKISGPEGLQQIKGFYDHALKGKWQGYRSSYLNETFRVIYWVNRDEVCVRVVEVNLHDYRK